MIYKLESEPCVYINLESADEILQTHQTYLQRKLAQVTMDLTVVTEEIVNRAKEQMNESL